MSTLTRQNTKYSKLIIYYFSGTGNARQAAKWIIEEAMRIGIETQLIEITKSKSHNKVEVSSSTLIGFCYPTHGFNAPQIILKTIWFFPQYGGQDVFLLNTRAGLKLSKIFIPGLSGLAQMLPALFLRLKGYRLVGFRPLDLPSNWIFFHPGLKEKVVKSIFKRCERITRKFAIKILRGDRVYRAWFDLPLDLAVSPISLAYYLIGRFSLAKTFFANSSCTGCGLCIKSCPLQAIRFIDNRPFWTFKCESCMRCINHCPNRAIETAHGFSFLIWWLIFSVIPISLASLINRQLNFSLANSVLANWIYYGLGLILIGLSYYGVHFLLRFKWINSVFKLTSLTAYKFWRRYKAPSKD